MFTTRLFRILVLAVLVFAVCGPAGLAQEPVDDALADEREGIERGAPAASLDASDPAAREQALRALETTGVLLVPDSNGKRIMALNPVTGNILDADFVTYNAVMATPIQAMLSADRRSILVSDQVNDVVHRFDLDGNYLGVFAPAGGADVSILDNIRGMALDPLGRLLVTVGGGANAHAIAMFDAEGSYLGNFIANGAGGLASPFDITRHQADWLVGGVESDAIHRYDQAGAYIANLAAINNFPEQIAEAANGNVLVANYSGEEGVIELTATGALVGRYDPEGLTGYRGVFELPNRNLLTTTGTGVYEINRAGELVAAKISGIAGRFITYARANRVVNVCNTQPISIPATGTVVSGPADPYPSNIVVNGAQRFVVQVRIHLLGVYHTWPDDIDILLVGPQGQNLVLMSDVGGSYDLVDADLILDDSAVSPLPDSALIPSGMYRPTNWGTGDTFPSPAPSPSSETALAVFNDSNPNGTWSLYVVDDAGGDTGTISGGWCLEITTKPWQVSLPLVLKN